MLQYADKVERDSTQRAYTFDFKVNSRLELSVISYEICIACMLLAALVTFGEIKSLRSLSWSMRPPNRTNLSS